MLGAMSMHADAQGNLEVVRNLVNKGNNLMRARHFAEAIGVYQEALKVDPGNVIAKSNIAEAHNNWGITYFSQHKYKEAADEWQKCVQMAPGHANAKRNLSIMMRTLAQQGVSLNEEDPTAAAGGSSPDGELNKAIVNKAAAAVKPPPPPPVVPGSLTAKVDPAKPADDSGGSGAVMILTPGLRQPNAAPAAPVSNDPVGFSGGGSGPGGYAASPASSVTETPAASAGAAATITVPPASGAPVTQPNYGSPSSAGYAANGISPSYTSGAGSTGYSANGITPSYDQSPSGALTGKGPVSPLFPVTPQQFVQPAATATNPASASGLVPGSSFAAGTAGGAAGQLYGAAPGSGMRSGASSLEEQLGSVELKVYGQKQIGMTVMQRIEKMERDTSGQVHSGTIIERIDSLKQSFGIQ